MDFKEEFKKCIAEFIGTFYLVFLGCGAVVLSEMESSYPTMAIPLVFGGAVSIMIYATGHISGAHFNPAVTIAFWVCRRFSLLRVPGYIFAQCFGALMASLLHYFIWGEAHSFGATHLSTSLNIGFVFEIVLSFSLMFVIISVATDTRAVGELAGIAIGSTVAICAFVGGPLTGASMNPARSLGPALMSGYLGDLWLYLLAPVVGATLGAICYEWLRKTKSMTAVPLEPNT